MTKSPAGWLPRDRDQLRAQRSLIEYVTNFTFVNVLCIVGSLAEARDWSVFRLGAIPELFWGAVEFVSLL